MLTSKPTQMFRKSSPNLSKTDGPMDTFNVQWSQCFLCSPPPFSVITRTLQKIQQDQATGLLVANFWPTQTCWPPLTRMLIHLSTSITTEKKEHTVPSSGPQCGTPTAQSDVSTPPPLVRQHLQS